MNNDSDSKVDVPRDTSIPHYTTNDPDLDNSNGSMKSDSDGSSDNQSSSKDSFSTNEGVSNQSNREYGDGITTTYDIDDHRVISLSFSDGNGQTVNAELAPGETERYTITSKLIDDDQAVNASETYSLADVVLNAYVLLGVIPPTNFDSIECSNKH